MPIPKLPEFLPDILGTAADVFPIPLTAPQGNPGALNYATGWPQATGIAPEAGGIAPEREFFNAVYKLFSAHLHFLQSGSLYTWSATLDYLPGAHVQGSDGKEYIAQKSTGPNVPGAPAVDPVGDVSGAWLLATLAYGAPIATDKKPGLVQPDGVTTFVTPEGILSAATLDPSWIGVPRYWRSTNLPPNHCWANGDFVEFADWPELKQVYDAGGFEGMLLPWDADSGTKAANLGKWRPDAANPTGLYTPNLGGQFFRNWGPGSEDSAGENNAPGLPGIIGDYGNFVNNRESVGNGALYQVSGYTDNMGAGVPGRATASRFGFDASRSNSIYGKSETVMPPSINQPAILYLGRSAQV